MFRAFPISLVLGAFHLFLNTVAADGDDPEGYGGFHCRSGACFGGSYRMFALIIINHFA